MIAVTQNLAYDFSNLDEFAVLRRTGVNAPFPRRRAFYLRPEYHEVNILRTSCICEDLWSTLDNKL